MSISEKLDSISKEIGGKLDDTGNIEKQLQEIYEIIKSGTWPSGGGTQERGVGFVGDFISETEILSTADDIEATSNCWVVIEFTNGTSEGMETFYNVSLFDEDADLDDVTLFGGTVPSDDFNHTAKVLVPLKEGQYLRVDTGWASCEVVAKIYEMSYYVDD